MTKLLEQRVGDRLIHFCDWGSQPYVHLVCTNQEHFQWIMHDWEAAEQVFSCDMNDQKGSLLFTCVVEKVTCPECLKVLQKNDTN